MLTSRVAAARAGPLLRLLCSVPPPFVLPSSCTTLGAALAHASAAFADFAVPEPQLSAEHLLLRAAGLGGSRAALVARHGAALEPAAAQTFEAMCQRRLERTPVQYILGDWDFHDLTLEVRPPVLIPRPETEELVELVLCAHSGAEAILDVGCGSGAIGLALLHALPRARCVGLDVSEAAAALSLDNAARCGLAARYDALRLPGGVKAYTELVPPPQFDLIVSNPPYIPAAHMAGLAPEVVDHEDERALCGGDDGLDVVRELLRAAPRLLCPEGPRAIWLEVDESHPPLLERWLAEPEQTALRLRLRRTHHDLAGRPRFCELRWGG